MDILKRGGIITKVLYHVLLVPGCRHSTCSLRSEKIWVLADKRHIHSARKSVMTLRKHTYSYILKISLPKTEKFLGKNSDIFFIFLLKT